MCTVSNRVVILFLGKEESCLNGKRFIKIEDFSLHIYNDNFKY